MDIMKKNNNFQLTLIIIFILIFISSHDKEEINSGLNSSNVNNTSSLVFPIEKDYNYVDSFGAVRTWGGERKHEGIDIMCKKGTPIRAVEAGKITKIGWNKYGGWRILILSKTRRWYYAHMCRYAKGLKKGVNVQTGQIIGYVGNTGYGPEGTAGKFEPHLHIQLWNIVDGKFKLINIYHILKEIE